MFRELQTVMIVKGDGREAQYAQLLFQILGKLPDFEASQPLTEKEYRASALSIDNIPNGKVIFFGNGNEAVIQGKSVDWEYNYFGMKYGWLGNRCVITADPAGISLGEQNAFAEYYNSRIEDFRKILDLKQIHYSKIITDGGVTGISEKIHATFERTDIWKHQYELLVCEYICSGFRRFMNNNTEKVRGGKAIIVYDPKDTDYANLLHNLIQQYSGYDVAEYTEKMFVDNAKNLSSKNKIIFLGKTKSSKERWVDINRYIYYKNGMRYGWRGNHAFIYAKPMKWSELEAFKEEYCQKGNEFKNKAKKYPESEGVDSAFVWGLVAGLQGLYKLPVPGSPAVIANYEFPDLVLPAMIAKVAWHVVDEQFNTEKMIEYQYQLLLREFVFNDLEKFMEEA